MFKRFIGRTPLTPTAYFTVFSEILGAAIVFLAFFQMLWVPWSTGETTYYSIGGYLPWSDASWWFSGGLRLLLDQKLNGLPATRIVNEAFFAVLLGVSGERLQFALLERAVLTAIATFLFVREVAYRLGIASAVVTTIVMITFIGVFTRTMMTEPTGFFYGTLGATLLLAGTDDQRSGLFVMGLFLVTVGLMARPGPFLVLPIIVLWAGRCFRGERRFEIRPTLWSAAGVASGLVLAALLHRLFTLPGAVPFDNFAYTLYGLAEGGQPWTVVLPQLKRAPAGLPPNVATEALAMIRANPVPFIAGMWSFVLRFLTDQFIYVKAYAWECCSAYRYARWYRLPFVVLEAIGLAYALRSDRTRIEGLCLLTFVGCLVSSAFTYWDSDAYRTFASTNALQALLVGLGASAVYRAFGMYRMAGQDFSSSTSAVIFVSATVISLSMIAPLAAAMIKPHHRPSSMSISWCAKGLTPIMIDLGGSSPFLRIGPPGSDGLVPNVAEDKFLRDKTFNNIDIARKLATLRSGDLLVLAHDRSGLNNGGEASEYWPVWLIIPGAPGLATPARYRVCATKEYVATDWASPPGQPFFIAQKVEPAV